jgi:tRNA(Arg) A34 adenosine deaminase TadA
MKTKSINIELPVWIQQHLLDVQDFFATKEERMHFVINLSRKNIEFGTGGPFAAAIFNESNGKLIAVGVNLVTSINLSIAHAEIVAIMQAQAILGNFDLGGLKMPRCELVTTTAPCAMCLGAIPWSGVRSLVCGARDEDARAVGFDEGAIRSEWISDLEIRGISVTCDVLREEAAAVLCDYVGDGGVLYNGRGETK